MAQILSSKLAWLSLWMAALGLSYANNLVSNGSFELGGMEGWAVAGGAVVRTSVSAWHGTNFLQLDGAISQFILIRPGGIYSVRYWNNESARLAIRFGDQSYTNPQPAVSVPGWRQYETFFTAQSSATLVEFTNLRTNGTRLDLIEVLDTAEPAHITRQPESLSVYENGNAAFTAVVEGGPPLSKQWFLGANPVPDATNSTLILTNVQAAQAGGYHLQVSNSVSTAASSNVMLNVMPQPVVPVIVAQPTGDTLASGYGLALSVSAIGSPPLSYEWQYGGTAIPGATNRVLLYASAEATHGGEYRVRVSNQHGSVLSLPALVTVTNGNGGGVVVLNNLIPRVPIYNVDGITRLSGSRYSAQLYAGPNPGMLRAAASSTTFTLGVLGGYFFQRAAILPDVAPGQVAYVQVRAWENSWGETYEEARARGGRFGSSTLETMIAGTNETVAVYVPMASFSLRAGQLFFTTGLLGRAEEGPGRQVNWRLTGDPGYTYLIERRSPPQNWLPLLLITNWTGTAIFTDPNPQNNSAAFYRARLLD